MVSGFEPDCIQGLSSELPSLQQCEACATNATEQRRWQVLVLIASGRSRQETSAATGYRLRTIRQIMQRYRTLGVAGLSDGRQHHSTPTLLSAAQQQALHGALQQPPPGGGSWTGPKVAQWMASALGKPVHRQRGWEYLQRFGLASLTAVQPPLCLLEKEVYEAFG